MSVTVRKASEWAAVGVNREVERRPVQSAKAEEDSTAELNTKNKSNM